MTKTRIAALLFATALSGGAAFAQTSVAPAAAGTVSAAGGFVQTQGLNQYRASKFSGLAVYGAENQKVGDINDLIVDGSGSVQAVVIGVGGFLGMGEKNVAVPFNSITWSTAKPPSGSATNATGTSATTTTGSTGDAAQAAANGYPDHGMIRMTKSDLQNAPAFSWYDAKK